MPNRLIPGLMGLLAAFVTMPAVGACELEEPDAWFHIDISLNRLGLPGEIHLDVHELQNGAPAIVARNDGAVPIDISGHTLADGAHVVFAGDSLAQALGLRFNNRSADHRPPNLETPPPQQFIVVINRSGKRLLIPGSVTYRPNAGYDPERQARSAARCGRRKRIWYIIVIGIMVGVAGVLVFQTVRGSS